MGTAGGRDAFRIKGIRREVQGDIARLVFSIDKTIVENENSTIVNKEILFEVPAGYAPFLVSERADALVALLIGHAIDDGCDIQSDVPVSEDFYHNLAELFIPVLDGRISLAADVLPPLPRGNSVGAGMQCDVDSLHAAMKYSGYRMERFRLTHLCASNLDYKRKDYSLTNSQNLEGARGTAEEIGLPFIGIRTDSCEAFPIGENARAYAEAFIALCLRKLWRCYFIPCPADNSVPNLLSCLSTPGLQLIPEGSHISEFGKISDISDFAPAWRHLRACRSPEGNCGRCEECSFCLLALDSLGKLDYFSEPFDIALYRGHRDRYLRFLAEKKDDSRFAQIYDSMSAKGDWQFASAVRAASAISRFDELWAENSPESDAEAVASIIPLASEDVRAASRLADAYASGRGTEKDRGKELECLRFMADQYRKEISGGFGSGCNLFDALWRSGESDGELMEAVRSDAEAGDPPSCARMSRAFAEGRGTEKDMDEAMAWMGKAAAADPSGYAEEYCSMLLSSEDPEKQAEAVRLCERYAVSLRKPGMCAMMSGMLRDGIGTEKNLLEASRWMSKAAGMDRSYELRWFRLAMDSGNPAAQAEAADACHRSCEDLSDPDYWVLMSEIYRDGIGVRKDIGEAVRWMRKAVAVRPSRLSYEYFRLLQSSDDPFHQKEAFAGASERFDKTNSTMYLALIARAYRDGKGVRKDIRKAAELMGKAFKESPSKYMREYCEILAESDDPKDNEEAFRRCESLYAKNGSPFSCKLLACMYRDGKGVGKDQDKALEWIRKYREATGGSDVPGYCAFLLSTDSESACSEAWETCSEYYSKTGDPKCCGIIARMYRDGKGVGKDLDKAIQWMEKAFLDDPAAWKAEFDGLLSLAE